MAGPIVATAPSRSREWVRFLAVLGGLPLAIVWLSSWRYVTAASLVMVAQYVGRPGVLAMAAAVLVVLPLVRLWPAGWAWLAGRVLGAVRHCGLYSRWWRRVVDSCGLTTTRAEDGATVTPKVRRVLTTEGGDVLDVRLLPGQTPEVYERQAEAIAHAWHVHTVRVTTPKRGCVRLRVLRHDPLTTSLSLETVPAALDLRAVPYAIGEDGTWRRRSYANVAGEVGGGVPGSGKTAGETSLACALIQNPAVQYVVVDGKGGQDWAWIRPRAAAFCAADDDFAAVLATIDQVHALMRHRLAGQLTERGESNFWNLPADPSHPAVFLVVDEVQTFTDVKGMTKDRRELAMQITARLAALVKKGRSAGIVTKLLTQKPTADAIPTAIRDNASVRTCWRVMTREAAHAVVGDILTTTALTPVDIPADLPGVAVVATDRDAELERVRYPHITEHAAAAIAVRTGHLRRPLEIPAACVPAGLGVVA